MRELFFKGGVFMYPLLLCSIVALAVVIERLIAFLRMRADSDAMMDQVSERLTGDSGQGLTSRVEGAAEICDATAGPIAPVIRAGLEKYDKTISAIDRAMEKASLRQISILERGLATLATLATISPLIGFLGTVSGMIRSFSVIAESATREPQRVAMGISEALITTAAGLLVAIPIYIAYNYFVNRIGKITLEMEESAGTLLDALADAGAVVQMRSEDD